MAIRREIRLRKEFLQKRQLEKQNEITNIKKKQIKSSIENNKLIPTELLDDARDLHHKLEMDVKEVPDIDDEFAMVGTREPKVCITTSRDPSSKLKQFSKEIKICIPNSQSINRGNYRMDELVNACKSADFTDIILLNETRGSPDGLILCHLPFGPTIYFNITNTVLRHDIPECKPCSQVYPHLILENFQSKVGQRIGKALQALYPVPKPESTRVLSYINNNDYISFRHHVFNDNKKDIELDEIGPRYELRPYEIRLGTLDQEDAEKEWALRSFTNTSRNKQVL